MNVHQFSYQLARKNGLLTETEKDQQTAFGDGDMFCELSF